VKDERLFVYDTAAGMSTEPSLEVPASETRRSRRGEDA